MDTKRGRIKIGVIPAIIWGKPADRLYLYIHGQGGSKEEAELLASVICPRGYQVLSVDLPRHGERRREETSCEPWNVVPELSSVMKYADPRWPSISLYAVSIGAWFSMLSFQNANIKGCLFLSPVLDMRELTSKMMTWAGVSEARLKEAGIIETDFGQTLSWKYWQYILAHPTDKWPFPTSILYGENDELIDRAAVDRFVQSHGCRLTVMKNGEHWFHTEEQL